MSESDALTAQDQACLLDMLKGPLRLRDRLRAKPGDEFNGVTRAHIFYSRDGEGAPEFLAENIMALSTRGWLEFSASDDNAYELTEAGRKAAQRLKPWGT